MENCPDFPWGGNSCCKTKCTNFKLQKDTNERVGFRRAILPSTSAAGRLIAWAKKKNEPTALVCWPNVLAYKSCLWGAALQFSCLNRRLCVRACARVCVCVRMRARMCVREWVRERERASLFFKLFKLPPVRGGGGGRGGEIERVFFFCVWNCP